MSCFRHRGLRIPNERSAGQLVPVEDAVPDFLRGLGEPEELAVFLVDDALVDQEVDVEGTPPVALAQPSPTRTTGIGSIVRVCTSVSVSKSSSKVP